MVLQGVPAEHKEEAFFNCWTRKEAYLKAVEVHNDLQSRRYIAMGLRSEEKVIYEPIKRTAGDYTPSNLRGVGTR